MSKSDPNAHPNDLGSPARLSMANWELDPTLTVRRYAGVGRVEFVPAISLADTRQAWAVAVADCGRQLSGVVLMGRLDVHGGWLTCALTARPETVLLEATLALFLAQPLPLPLVSVVADYAAGSASQRAIACISGHVHHPAAGQAVCVCGYRVTFRAAAADGAGRPVLDLLVDELQLQNRHLPVCARDLRLPLAGDPPEALCLCVSDPLQFLHAQVVGLYDRIVSTFAATTGGDADETVYCVTDVYRLTAGEELAVMAFPARAVGDDVHVARLQLRHPERFCLCVTYRARRFARRYYVVPYKWQLCAGNDDDVAFPGPLIDQFAEQLTRDASEWRAKCQSADFL